MQTKKHRQLAWAIGAAVIATVCAIFRIVPVLDDALSGRPAYMQAFATVTALQMADALHDEYPILVAKDENLNCGGVNTEATPTADDSVYVLTYSETARAACLTVYGVVARQSDEKALTISPTLGRNFGRILTSSIKGFPLQRKARELVAVLRAELQRDDIDKHEVNSVLYRDLTDNVRCDTTFNWRINQQPAGQNSPAAEAELSRAEMIRTIYRLRAGLPPCENLEHLTVGADKALGVVRALLKDGPSGAWAIVRGDYGGGKSHALTLFADTARREGYATCHLSADGYANALNHPQRFLPSLLASLDIPLRPTYGYTDLLYDVMSDAQLADRLSSIVNSHLDGWTSVASETRMCLSRILQLLHNNDSRSEEWIANLRLVTSHLTGDSIRHLTAAPTYRRTAYNLLSIARDMLLEVGMKGVAIAIDETESIYTKLPNARSRQGALRVLAGLCQFSHCRVMLAVTPDAFRNIVSDVSLTFHDFSALPIENVPNWVNALNDGAVPIVDCRQLSREQRKELLEVIRVAYVRAYGDEFASDGFKHRWETATQLAGDLQLPIRLLVRRAIDVMDSSRYSG